MSYIEFKNVCKEYKMGEITIKALNNTNFKIEKGELVVIVGPSGAGKTTALNILGGMDSVTSGDVIVKYVDIDTDEEILSMAQTYVRNVYGDNIPNLKIESSSESEIIIQVYEDMDDHWLTYDRYYINRYTATGTNFIGDTIDLK